MSKCTKCGANFVGFPESPPVARLCHYCERDELRADLKRAVSELFDARAVLEEVRPIIKSVLVEREELDESILGRIEEALKP